MNNHFHVQNQLKTGDLGGGGGRGGMMVEGHSRIKQIKMLVVSLRGVNSGFWSPFGCSWQDTRVFNALKVMFRVACKKCRNIN